MMQDDAKLESEGSQKPDFLQRHSCFVVKMKPPRTFTFQTLGNPTTWWGKHQALSSPQELSHLAFQSYNLVCWCRAGLGFIEVTKAWPLLCQENSIRIKVLDSPHFD